MKDATEKAQAFFPHPQGAVHAWDGNVDASMSKPQK